MIDVHDGKYLNISAGVASENAPRSNCLNMLARTLVVCSDTTAGVLCLCTPLWVGQRHHHQCSAKRLACIACLLDRMLTSVLLLDQWCALNRRHNPLVAVRGGGCSTALATFGLQSQDVLTAATCPWGYQVSQRMYTGSPYLNARLLLLC